MPEGQPITDYHGYGAIDFYGVEEHFGTLPELQELAEAAHAIGLKLVQDEVANHTGPYHPWVARSAYANLVSRDCGQAHHRNLAALAFD